MTPVGSDNSGAPLCPLFLDVAAKRVLVVGAGAVGARRIRSLVECGARVTVVAPSAMPSVERLASGSVIELLRREFLPEDVEGHVLVFSATGVAGVDASVSSEARSRGVFVNVADDLGLSDFHVPAIARRGDVQVAVSTGGTSPGLAAIIRDRLARSMHPGWGALARVLGQVRGLARTALPDARERMAVMKRAAGDAELLDEVTRGGMPDPHAVLARALDSYRRAGEAPSVSVPAGGMVSIVGAGPGDPGLVTVAGLERIRSADVIVYDDLVDPRLLEQAPSGVQLIYGGKRGWQPNDQRPGPDLLVAKAQQDGGRRVVRLKGGDPSVFGRLHEELRALAEAGIAHEVIPGVTAAVAAAASAHVSLTRRGHAASITLATAVREGSTTGDTAHWASLLESGETLALYMGVRHLGELAEGMIGAGADPAVPVVVVAGASTPDERVVHATLGTAEELTRSAVLASPALVLLGRALGRD